MMACKLLAFLQPIPRREGAAQLCAPLHPWYPQCLCKCHMKPWVLSKVCFLFVCFCPPRSVSETPIREAGISQRKSWQGDQGAGIQHLLLATLPLPLHPHRYVSCSFSSLSHPPFVCFGEIVKPLEHLIKRRWEASRVGSRQTSCCGVSWHVFSCVALS